MIVGGLRRRIIKENLYLMLEKALTDLGWFESTLVDYPVELLTEAVENPKEITPNKIAISAEELSAREWEMGSDLDEYRWETYIDIFAEDESTGLHLSGDIYDILRGKMASIGRPSASLDVYDLTQDGEPYLFTCELRNVETARVREWTKEYGQYWWVVGFEILDYYYGE